MEATRGSRVSAAVAARGRRSMALPAVMATAEKNCLREGVGSIKVAPCYRLLGGHPDDERGGDGGAAE
jgi:hypothetical protein